MELILLLLSFLLLSSTTSNASDAVLDSDGEELQRGQLYYAQSIFWGTGAGGLRLESLEESCPLYVAKANSLDVEGQPLAFLPENENDDTVLEGRTLNIKFAVSTNCSESTMWKYELSTNYVRTGGNASNAVGPDYSRFAITEAEVVGVGSAYHIRVCPCSVGVERASCKMPCFDDLGVVGGEVKRALGINSNNPHAVIFVKKKNGGVASSVLRSKA